MNIEILNNAIQKYKEHISNIEDIEAINERNERKYIIKLGQRIEYKIC